MRCAVVRVITLVLVVTGAVEKNPNQIGAVKRVERFLQLSFFAFCPAYYHYYTVAQLYRGSAGRPDTGIRHRQNERAIDDNPIEGLSKAIHEGGKAARPDCISSTGSLKGPPAGNNHKLNPGEFI